MRILASVETPDWVWFETGLSYDNARLPQALLLTGMATKTPSHVDAGLKSLHWLMRQQTAPAGHFRPVGSAGFGEQRQPPRAFDQQPFAWFLGSNDLSVALADPETGSCCDGLHPDRANENLGGESVLSYLLGLAEIRQLARSTAGLTRPQPLRALRA